LSDVGGENLRSLMRVGTMVPSTTRESATKFLNERQAGQYSRINKDVEETMLGRKAASINVLKNDLDKIRKEAAGPYYEKASKAKIENTKELAELLRRMPKAVLEEGKSIYQIEGKPIPKLPGNVEEIVESPIRDSQGNVIRTTIKTEPNDFRIYDFIKHGLDNEIDKPIYKDEFGKWNKKGQALLQLKTDFLNYLDTANDSYGKARSLWAGPTRAQRQLDKGYKVFRENPDAVAEEFARLSDNDKQYFRLGLAQAIKDINAGKGTNIDKAKAIFDNEASKQKLKTVFPSEAAFQDFSKRMETEMSMSKSRNFLLPTAGSQTAPRLTDVQEMGGAQQNALKTALSGNLPLAALQLAPGLYGKSTGITSDVAAALERSLLTPGLDTAEFAKQIAASRKASDLARQRKGQAAKALTVPFAIPGATEQYK